MRAGLAERGAKPSRTSVRPLSAMSPPFNGSRARWFAGDHRSYVGRRRWRHVLVDAAPELVESAECHWSINCCRWRGTLSPAAKTHWGGETAAPLRKCPRNNRHSRRELGVKLHAVMGDTRRAFEEAD